MGNIIKQLLDDQRKILKLYALGALLFFIGLGTIQWADKLMQPSLEQEGYALLGTFIGGLGFFTAMLAQVFLIIYRLRKMGKRD
jgi:hypothetical protein